MLNSNSWPSALLHKQTGVCSMRGSHLNSLTIMRHLTVRASSPQPGRRGSGRPSAPPIAKETSAFPCHSRTCAVQSFNQRSQIHFWAASLPFRSNPLLKNYTRLNHDLRTQSECTKAIGAARYGSSSVSDTTRTQLKQTLFLTSL